VHCGPAASLPAPCTHLHHTHTHLTPPAADGSELPASVIGVDQDKDIAVLQLLQQSGKADSPSSLSKVDGPGSLLNKESLQALVPLSICTTSTDLQVGACRGALLPPRLCVAALHRAHCDYVCQLLAKLCRRLQDESNA
jgi:hypothetical protein